MTSRRAVAVLCRHGHRAPVVNIAQHLAEKELWDKLMPSDQTTDLVTRNYPLNIEPSNPPPRDGQTKPFGFITTVGLTAMTQVGERLVAEFPFIKRVDKIKVFATNYRRTQLSVQALLTGIQVKHRTVVEVRPQATCSMSCYEAHSDVLIPTMKRVQSTADFQHATERLRDVQEAMGNAFPALTAHGFEWIHALDYFVCRRSHSLDVLPSVQNFEEAVQQHTAWRFQQYYQDPLHMSQVAGPLLRDIVSQLERTFASAAGERDSNATMSVANNLAASGFEKEPQPDVTIFSGHDVNLMALGYALGIGAALRARTNTIWWPGYGSTLTFDAYRIAPAPAGESSESATRGEAHGGTPADGEVRVRVALDFADMSRVCAQAVPLMLSKFEKSDHPKLSTLAEELQPERDGHRLDVPLSALKRLAGVMNRYVETHEFIRQLLSESEVRAEVP